MAARQQRAPTLDRRLYHDMNVLHARECQHWELVVMDLPDDEPDYIWPNEKPAPALRYVRKVLAERYGPVTA